MRKEVKTGLYAVIVIAVTLIAVEFLKGKDIFSRTDTYYIICREVDGLEISTPVTVGGFHAGRISDIEYNRESMDYTVTISMSREFEFPEDSRMTAYSSDILGTKKIKVVAGTSSVPASSGDTLQSGSEADMLSSIAESIQPAVSGLDSLIRNINRAVSSVNLIMDDDNRAAVKDILLKLDSTASALAALSSAINGSSPEITGIISRIGSITVSLDSAAASAGNAIANAEEVTASLRDAQLGATADSLRALLVRMQDPSGSIGRLLTSDSLHNSVTRLSNDLDSLVRSIRNDPKKYIKISVF